jgi:hypothetical protein
VLLDVLDEVDDDVLLDVDEDVLLEVELLVDVDDEVDVVEHGHGTPINNACL